MNPTISVLLVDDDVRLSVLLSRFLGEQGFAVHLAANGKEMHRRLESNTYDLLILDINLPGDDGLVLCRQLRHRGNRIPIIMLTARGEDADRINGLELGADDYLTKPFNPMELLARMRAVLRRQPASAYTLHSTQGKTYRFGDFVLQIRQKLLCKGDEQIRLSSGEFALLRLFLAEPGQPLSRQQLMLRMASREHQPDQRAIDMLVSRLRKRLDEPMAAESMIRALRGIGYVLVADVVEGPES
jgi:two-component system phosphate regulon response regulator OmpR